MTDCGRLLAYIETLFNDYLCLSSQCFPSDSAIQHKVLGLLVRSKSSSVSKETLVFYCFLLFNIVRKYLEGMLTSFSKKRFSPLKFKSISLYP